MAITYVHILRTFSIWLARLTIRVNVQIYFHNANPIKGLLLSEKLTIAFLRRAAPKPPSWPIASSEDQYRQKSYRDYFEPSARE